MGEVRDTQRYEKEIRLNTAETENKKSLILLHHFSIHHFFLQVLINRFVFILLLFFFLAFCFLFFKGWPQKTKHCVSVIVLLCS